VSASRPRRRRQALGRTRWTHNRAALATGGVSGLERAAAGELRSTDAKVCSGSRRHGYDRRQGAAHVPPAKSSRNQ
jgi:NAD(P)-dependent dehydrogenase (short-subunit alcohol dehydrogenase family)